MTEQLRSGFITYFAAMWQSYPADGRTISCGFLASPCCIWISRIPHCITPSTSIESILSISGIYNCWITKETCKTIAILDLEGSLALILQYTHTTHTKSRHSHKHFLSLSACSATHTRHKGQGTSSNTEQHRSTFGTVFVATLDDILL